MASESLLGNITAGSLIPLVLVIGGTLVLREVDLEIHRNDLRTVQHQHENAQALITYSQERMAAWNGLQMNLGGCYATLEDTDKARKLRHDTEKQLENEILAYLALLKSTRERLMQTTIAELRLQDNRLYLNARITSIVPEGVGFTHSQGITRVEGKLLPPALRDLVQLGVENRLESLLPFKQSPAVERDPDPSWANTNTPTPLPATPDPSALAAQAREKDRNELALAYEREIAVYQSRLAAIRSRAEGMANRRPTARIHSAPAQATRAEMEAREVEAKILQLQGELYHVRRAK